MKPLQFTVFGAAVAQGSKTIRPIIKGGKVVSHVPVEANKNLQPWRRLVSETAYRAYREYAHSEMKHLGEPPPLFRGPVAASMVFYFPRPTAHFGTGRNAHQLKASAPVFHSQIPDCDKLVRAVGDALTGIVLYDDRLIAGFDKLWKEWGEPARVEIGIRVLGEPLFAAGQTPKE